MSQPLPTLTPEYAAEDIGYQLVNVAIAFIPLTMFFVGLRFYSRRLSRTKLGWDDYLCIISLVLQIGESALAICFVIYGGVGRHFTYWEENNPTVATNYFKYLLAVSFYYFFCVAWPKLAILALYLRLFTLKPYRITVWCLIGVVVTTGIICPIMSLNLCHPFEYNWNRTIPGWCLDEQSFYRWGSLPNIITDVAMLILPLPIVWKLQTSYKLKLGLTVAFSTGSLGLATSILRFSNFFQGGSAVEDGTWSSVDLMIWTLVEPNVYLIAACLPTYRPIFMHLLRNTPLVSQGPNKRSYGSETARSGASKVGVRDHTAGGFRRFDESKNSSDHSDDIGLVEAGSRFHHTELRGAPSSKIHVQNGYDVTVTKA